MDSEHVIEPAKSGRAACRKCRKKILKDELRLGVAIDGDYGNSYQWYHLGCGSQVKAKELEGALAEFEGEVPDRADLDAAIAKNRNKKAKADREYPFAEKAASGRSTCIGCEDKIPKGEMRVAVEMEIDTGAFTTVGARYLHAKCSPKFIGEDAAALLPKLKENSGLEDAEFSELEAALS